MRRRSDKGEAGREEQGGEEGEENEEKEYTLTSASFSIQSSV